MLHYRLIAPQLRTPLVRRASGFALAIAINVLLLLLLLGLGASRVERKPRSTPTIVFDVPPEARPSAPAPSSSPEQAQPKVEPTPALKPPPIVIPSKPTIQPKHFTPLLELSKADLASADIAHLAHSGDGSSGDSEEVGRGPNGEVLYAAEWARHPTNAELGGYLPANAPDGFGLVACKTIPGDRVEDCIELDQSPHGSRLAGAVRQAAWQFRVRPPRKNGKPLVGSWVQIRIDYERG